MIPDAKKRQTLAMRNTQGYESSHGGSKVFIYILKASGFNITINSPTHKFMDDFENEKSAPTFHVDPFMRHLHKP